MKKQKQNESKEQKWTWANMSKHERQTKNQRKYIGELLCSLTFSLLQLAYPIFSLSPSLFLFHCVCENINMSLWVSAQSEKQTMGVKDIYHI